MTTFNIRPDDAGLQNLKIKNAKPATAKAVTPITASTSAHTAHTAPVDDQGEEYQPVNDERRKQQRRRNKDQTIFDTRADSERRKASAISAAKIDETDEADDTDTPVINDLHIDVNA
ncbi:MAG: hypothetical protein GXP22_06300 [Gammaproteobacteria bacterium]|nr:hypothetical protein [Gammaproteobacteria bacterium]